MELHKAILQDRKNRRGLSRSKYAELVGLTENRVHGLEQGRKLKAGELEILQPFLGDLLAEEEPDTSASDEFRAGVMSKYLEAMTHYDAENPPPMPWPSMYRVEDAPDEDLQKILDWLNEFAAWLDGGVGDTSEPEVVAVTDGDLEGTEATSRADEVPVSDPVVVQEPLDVEDLPTIDTMMDGLRIVTNGEMQTYKRCKRKWYLSYYRRLAPEFELPMGTASIGTRVHKALAAWYSGGDPWRVFDESVKVDEEKLLEIITPDDDRTQTKFAQEVDLARAIVDGYFEWVNQERMDSNLEVIGAETVVDLDPKFPAPLDHVRLKAKLDVKLLRTTDNARLFMDHKTVGDFSSPQKTLQLDEQMLTYALIDYMNALADEDPEARADGALYNMMRRVKRTPTANPPFYQRVEVRHNINALRSYWMRVQGTIQNMEDTSILLDAGKDHRVVAYPTPNKNCAWDCEFRDVCYMMDDGSRAEAYLEDHYVAVNPLRRYEPELEGRTE